VSEAPPAETPPRRRDVPTFLYIASVWSVGLGLTATAMVVYPIQPDQTFVVLCLLSLLTWWSGPTVVEGRVRLSFSIIVMLAAIALLGPAGAGVVGLLMGPLQRGAMPLRARVFNTGMSAILGVLGGVAYLSTGGKADSRDLSGTMEILRHIGLPILVADLVHLAVNLVLLAGVVRLAAGVPMRTQITRVLTTTGTAYIGYGMIAFLMVVLWEPAGLGPTSVLLVLAPLLVARWAYIQYAEEVKGHERALQVLVAAVEAKAPHLAGHSSRVAELSAHMAEHLGLRSHVVADVRLAGMLHDLGQTTLPTALVRGSDARDEALAAYPAHGAALLGELAFLDGSLDAVRRHRDVLALPREDRQDPRDLPAFVVGLADEFDLLTAVGTPEGLLLGDDEALQVLRARTQPGPEVLRALQHALSRRTGATA
jgi:HD domain